MITGKKFDGKASSTGFWTGNDQAYAGSRDYFINEDSWDR